MDFFSRNDVTFDVSKNPEPTKYYLFQGFAKLLFTYVDFFKGASGEGKVVRSFSSWYIDQASGTLKVTTEGAEVVSELNKRRKYQSLKTAWRWVDVLDVLDLWKEDVEDKEMKKGFTVAESHLGPGLTDYLDDLGKLALEWSHLPEVRPGKIPIHL